MRTNYPKLSVTRTRPVSLLFDRLLTRYFVSIRLLDKQKAFGISCGYIQISKKKRKRPNVFERLINENATQRLFTRRWEDNNRERNVVIRFLLRVLTQLCEKLLSHKNIKVSLNLRRRWKPFSQIIILASQPISWGSNISSKSSNAMAFFMSFLCTAMNTEGRSTSRQNIHLRTNYSGRQVSFIWQERRHQAGLLRVHRGSGL